MGASRIDFTSALYLGLRHPALALVPWPALTLGKPAALEETAQAAELCVALAALMQCQAASLLTSTLHLFWDLFGMFAADRTVLLVDAAAYPVARWGAQRAAALGMPVQVFPHARAGQAEQLARHWTRTGRRVLILADGYTPGKQRPPPLADYAEIAHRHAGWLLLDDTQALGVLGRCGGGSAAQRQLEGAPLLVGASLAKGFGAPLAVLAGRGDMIAWFEAKSQTRVHASPPCAATVAAAWHALRVNRGYGDVLRARLAVRVTRLRRGLRNLGLECRGGSFPVQVVPLAAGIDGPELHGALARQGINVLLQGTQDARMLTFLVRADQGLDGIDCAVAGLNFLLKETA